MTTSEKIKTIDEKIEQSKAQYNSDTQTATFQVYHQKMVVDMNL